MKNYLKHVKPSIKGAILVLFGIFNTRWGISVDIFTTNIIYGPLAYLFLTLSGIIIIKLFQVLDTDSYKGKLTKKRALASLGTSYLIGLSLTIVNVVLNITNYYFNFPIIIFTAFIGVLWCLLGYIGFKSKERIPIVKICFISFTFSIGLIYGAFLNLFVFPFYIYCFFFSISFLQLSREVTKDFHEVEEPENNMSFPFRISNDKLLKFSLLFQILALIFLALSIFIALIYPTLFLFIALPDVIIMILASFLTLASILEKKNYKKISSLLKIVIFLELIILLIVGK